MPPSRRRRLVVPAPAPSLLLALPYELIGENVLFRLAVGDAARFAACSRDARRIAAAALEAFTSAARFLTRLCTALDRWGETLCVTLMRSGAAHAMLLRDAEPRWTVPLASAWLSDERHLSWTPSVITATRRSEQDDADDEAVAAAEDYDADIETLRRYRRVYGWRTNRRAAPTVDVDVAYCLTWVDDTLTSSGVRDAMRAVDGRPFRVAIANASASLAPPDIATLLGELWRRSDGDAALVERLLLRPRKTLVSSRDSSIGACATLAKARPAARTD